MYSNFLKDTWPHRSILAHHFLHITLPRENLPSNGEGPSISPWNYTLLLHYISTLDRKFKVSRPFSCFETLCIMQTPQRHLESTMHSLLFSNIPSNTGRAFTTWKNDLSLSLSPEDWELIYLNIHKGSVNVSTQENGYKIQARWYRNPTLIHKFCLNLPDTCWRCQLEKGNLLHVWWS